MSQMLKRGEPHTQHQLHRQVFRGYPSGANPESQRKVNLLFIFSSSSKRSLSEAQTRFIGKLLAYMSHSRQHSKAQLEQEGRELALGASQSPMLTRHKRIASKGSPES